MQVYCDELAQQSEQAQMNRLTVARRRTCWSARSPKTHHHISCFVMRRLIEWRHSSCLASVCPVTLSGQITSVLEPCTGRPWAGSENLRLKMGWAGPTHLREPKPLNQFWRNLVLLTTFGTPPHMNTLVGVALRWWSGQMCDLSNLWVSFLLFFFFCFLHCVLFGQFKWLLKTFVWLAGPQHPAWTLRAPTRNLLTYLLTVEFCRKILLYYTEPPV